MFVLHAKSIQTQPRTPSISYRIHSTEIFQKIQFLKYYSFVDILEIQISKFPLEIRLSEDVRGSIVDSSLSLRWLGASAFWLGDMGLVKTRRSPANSKQCDWRFRSLPDWCAKQSSMFVLEIIIYLKILPFNTTTEQTLKVLWQIVQNFQV